MNIKAKINDANQKVIVVTNKNINLHLTMFGNGVHQIQYFEENYDGKNRYNCKLNNEIVSSKADIEKFCFKNKVNKYVANAISQHI